MKKTLLSLALVFACLLTGCAERNENSAVSSQSDSVSQDTSAEQENSATRDEQDESLGENGALITAAGAGCCAELSLDGNGNGTLEVAVGEMKFTRSLSGDYLKNTQTKLELVQLDSWNIAALRTPSDSADGADSVELYYFTDSTLQELYYLAGFRIPRENKITADIDSNCFSFTDSNGNLQRFTVVYDEFGGSYPFRLRNADYVETAVIQTQNAALGEVRLSYNTYGENDSGIIISNFNFVELVGEKTQRCAILSPVYQGGGSYDNLTTIAAPMKLEVLDFTDWGIAAVRVPYPEGAYDEPTASLSLIYFDAEKIMPLDHGLFIPDIDADDVISCDPDTNSFTLTLKDGTVTQYFVSPERGGITETAVVNAN